MSKFKPGASGNPTGRPKGTPNKTQGKVRDMIASLLEDEFDSVRAEFRKLEGREKVKAFTEMLPYIAPKLQSVSGSFELERLPDEQLDEIIQKLIGHAE